MKFDYQMLLKSTTTPNLTVWICPWLQLTNNEKCEMTSTIPFAWLILTLKIFK